MEKHVYCMPDYYPSFSCKMGSCRNACCTGWPVSFPLEDYFKLINEDCSPALRDRLDRGIKISLHPTPDRYAEILPRYDGNCPIRLEDGRCAIHAELGEKALSHVCRLYPRGIRKEYDGYEISCANSCEAVLEALLPRTEPIGFISKELDIGLPPLPERTVFFETCGHERDIRLSLIRTMQDRALTLPERLVALNGRLLSLNKATSTEEESAVNEWLRSENSPKPMLPDVEPEHFEEGLNTAKKLIGLIDERSVSVRAYGGESLRLFGDGENAYARYEAAKNRFETVFPDWDVFFEHMLVNHMNFSCFPFEDRPEDLRTEYMAICAVYTLLRFLGIGCSESRNAREEYIDLFAAAFRLIDHTEFDIYVSHLLSDLGWTEDLSVLGPAEDGEILEWIIL